MSPSDAEITSALRARVLYYYTIAGTGYRVLTREGLDRLLLSSGLGRAELSAALGLLPDEIDFDLKNDMLVLKRRGNAGFASREDIAERIKTVMEGWANES